MRMAPPKWSPSVPSCWQSARKSLRKTRRMTRNLTSLSRQWRKPRRWALRESEELLELGPHLMYGTVAGNKVYIRTYICMYSMLRVTIKFLPYARMWKRASDRYRNRHSGEMVWVSGGNEAACKGVKMCILMTKVFAIVPYIGVVKIWMMTCSGTHTMTLFAPLLQDEERKQRKDVFEEADFRARHRSLGNIRFIGELFKLKVWETAVRCSWHCVPINVSPVPHFLWHGLFILFNHLSFPPSSVATFWSHHARVCSETAEVIFR